MATNYQKFVALLVKWPINPHKKTRDYAFHLRLLLKEQNANGDFFPGKPGDSQKRLDSLLRLSENRYGLKYPATHEKGASGMIKEDVKVVLMDEFIDYFNKSQAFLKHIFK